MRCIGITNELYRCQLSGDPFLCYKHRTRKYAAKVLAALVTAATLCSGCIWVYKWKTGTTAEQQIRETKNELLSLHTGLDALSQPWNIKDLEPDIQDLLNTGNISAAQTMLKNRVAILSTKKASYSYALARIALLQLDESQYIAHLTNAVSEDPANAIYLLELHDAFVQSGKKAEARDIVETALQGKNIALGSPQTMLKLTMALDRYPPSTWLVWRRMYEICLVRDGRTLCPLDRSAANESAALIATLQDAERSLLSAPSNDKHASATLYIVYRLLVMVHDIRDEAAISDIYDARSETLRADISRDDSPWGAVVPATQSLLTILVSKPDRVRPYLSSLLELSEHLTDTSFPLANFAPMGPREARALFRSKVFFYMALYFDKYGEPHQTHRAMELAISELENNSMPSAVTIILRPAFMLFLYQFYEKNRVSGDKIISLRSKMTAALSAVPTSALKEELASAICLHNPQPCSPRDAPQAERP